jgi:alkylation response protein AidB-like acyl-CoA dehydrogenase
VLHAAIGLAGQIREASDEIERSRRLPPDIAAAMKEAGVFGMAMPRVWGGPELDPLTQFRVIEALAMADGSVGWCAMIGCDGGYVTAFLDQAVARAMYPDILVGTGAAATTKRCGCPGVTASAGASRSSADANTANGSGWAAPS